MFGKTLKAFILLQLVVLVTLAPILFAQRLGPQRVPSIGEQQRAHEEFLNQYPEETRATIRANRGFTMQIPGHSAPAYISPAHIGYYRAIKVPSESLKECLLNHMMERGQPFFAEHPGGDLYFYSERTRGKGFEEEQVEETQAAGVREVLSREGSRTVILPKSNLAGEVAETSRKARSGNSSLRKIWKRDFPESLARTSVQNTLSSIDEEKAMLFEEDQNKLLDTELLKHQRYGNLVPVRTNPLRLTQGEVPDVPATAAEAAPVQEVAAPATAANPVRSVTAPATTTKGSWFSGWKFPSPGAATTTKGSWFSGWKFPSPGAATTTKGSWFSGWKFPSPGAATTTKGSWFSGWKFPSPGDRSLSPPSSTKQVNRLLETSKLTRSAGSRFQLTPAGYQRQALAIKMPGNGWSGAIANRMMRKKRPFFVEGADRNVWYRNPENQPTRFVRTKDRFDEGVRRANSEHEVTTAKMPPSAIRPAATEARSGLSWTQRLTKGLGSASSAFKYLRGF
ncbi:hypothetical protein NDA11_006762 [Ustilago hordei]|nr:hypothetical protein NDA10_006353 [Ustilago hordei]KAJ1572652.1 hypothetical protein NDA11_006762 [Ustilago hordei]KAJ1591332.1 hypothetical protein NDA15_007615 [Ustilago hordei]KAJ1593377.1 hypothetical protein NDA12_000386 [Ustilago hordei]KAJ1603589.1 hypothetical protein NDA14_004442 [Ustilago hordei]